MASELMNSLMPKYEAIPAEEVLQPSPPVNIAIKEARMVATFAEEDEDKFELLKIEAGEVASQIYMAADALEEAEAAWDAVSDIKTGHEEEWKITKPLAYELRNDRAELYTIIFDQENMPNELAQIRRLTKGASDSDMVLDLFTLHDISVRHSEILTGYKISAEDIEAIKVMHDKVKMLMVEASADRVRPKDEKDIRDRAFTYMHSLVTQLYRGGKYLFRKDEKRKRCYRSEYRATIARRYKDRLKDDESETMANGTE